MGVPAPEPAAGGLDSAGGDPEPDPGAKLPAGEATLGPGVGVGAFDQAAVAANSGERGPEAELVASAGSETAGTVIRSLHEGHFAKASARDSVVVRNLPQCGQLNSIATLTTLSVQALAFLGSKLCLEPHVFRSSCFDCLHFRSGPEVELDAEAELRGIAVPSRAWDRDIGRGF